MQSKDKKIEKTKANTKKITIYFIIAILLVISIFLYKIIIRNDVYAKETDDNQEQNDIKISNAKQIDIDAIIAQNTQNTKKEEYITNEVELEYITKYKNSSSIASGTYQVVQEGREGKQEIVIKRNYENGQIVSEEQISSKITKSPVDKIVEVGTGTGIAKHNIQVGDPIYVTSDRASIRVEPNENSEKIATLEKNTILKVLEIQNGWYKITGNETVGYIKAENTAYKNSETEKANQTNSNTRNNNTSIQKLTFDIQLNKPSGLTLEQFEKILTDSKDKNNIFKSNAKYFYYIEQQYNINGIFVAAVGIHESNWGTSKIATNKYNLFGYGAYDSNPYNGAYTFSNYSESIDLISRVFVKYYINPEGTSIYGGEKASGKYYNGSTLSGINKKYATDKNWANAVYKNMEYLYNKL